MVTFEDWRYVADVTISRCIARTSHPVRTNSVASQSSSSGCDWRLALDAEILLRLHDADAEIHLPEPVDGDARVSGWPGSTSHFASVSRLSGASLGSGGSIAGTPG